MLKSQSVCVQILVINLLIVWFLTGLWHGASWNFVSWGLYFGIILILEKLFILKLLEKAPAFIGHIYSLIIIIFGWGIFYFSDDCGGMNGFLGFMSSLFSGGIISGPALNTVISYLPLLIVSIIAATPIFFKVYQKIAGLRHMWLIDTAATVVVLIICTASLCNQSYNPLLYFRF